MVIRTSNYPAPSNATLMAVKVAIRTNMSRYAVPGTWRTNDQEQYIRMVDLIVEDTLSGAVPPEYRTPDVLIYRVGMMCQELGADLGASGVQALREQLDSLLHGV